MLIHPPYIAILDKYCFIFLALEDTGTTFLRNAESCSPKDTASHPSRIESSVTQLWELAINILRPSLTENKRQISYLSIF
jgi:hypothetical protein